MSDYLTTQELADLIGCKPNQRALMARWLENNGWPFVIDRNGIPKVACAYHDKKLGLIDEAQSTKYADGPDLDAFKPLTRLKKR
ncbi:DUF4224 domain-containing protein [Paraburkholderia phytofirmans]|jgi:hypothetical protein|uniref:DUF4224 domain-containing protein n=1 Tax=Paraburkholderia phytofirmans TaxID=261302 RepID=UPI0038BA1577